MASAMIPSGVLGKLGSVSKLLSNTQRGAKLGKALANISKSTGINTSNLTASVYNTTSEAYFEAKEARDQVREALAIREGYSSFAELPEEIQTSVDNQAGEAAARVFNANVVSLAIPNFFESK